MCGGMQMKKLPFKTARAALVFALALALTGSAGALAEDLVPVGRAVGIEAETAGVLVASLSKVRTPSGEASPAADAGVLPGDVITRVGGEEVRGAEDFRRALGELDGGSVELTVVRDEKTVQLSVDPVQDADGVWRLGLWLRANVSGIGTVTYYDPSTGEYGALGHSINDADTGVMIPIGEGNISEASVDSVVRGERGKAGELHGSYDAGSSIGTVDANTPRGIFGSSSSGFDGEPLPVAEPGEIEDGPATILANVSGHEVGEYAVEIERADSNGEKLLVTVTDPALLELTGGIVQGMSGSPIIQNGKLVGAVTHVLVSDPARGYGVTLRSMREAEKAA